MCDNLPSFTPAIHFVDTLHKKGFLVTGASANVKRQFCTACLATVGFIICFVFLLIPTLALAAWLPLAFMAGASRVVYIRTELFVAMVAALIFYFKWPWVAVLVSWADMALIAFGLLPLEEKSLSWFLFQFMFDIAFFLAAHGGFVAHVVAHRYRGEVKN